MRPGRLCIVRYAVSAGAVVSVATMLLSAPAAAQTIYRCGNAYTTEPCRDGRVLETTDPRSAAQRAEARRVAADERRLADGMARERAVRETALRPALASSLSAPRAAALAASAPRGHAGKKRKPSKAGASGDDAPFIARVPGDERRSVAKR